MPDDPTDDYEDLDDEDIDEGIDEWPEYRGGMVDKIPEFRTASKVNITDLTSSKISLNKDINQIATLQKLKKATSIAPGYPALEPCIPRRKFLTEQIVHLDPDVLEIIKSKHFTGNL